jgi:cell division protein FtsI (penicillin-binding protein 3)
VLGFCSGDGDGLEGIELAFHRQLGGTAGWREVGANAYGYRYTLPESSMQPPLDGNDVLITIDRVAQSVLERELERCVTENGANCATGIVMDPRTGDILAMASFPTYEPQRYGDSDADCRRNRAITDLFEPGSTFKAVTAAACFEEGAADRNTLIESCQVLELNGGLMRDKEDYGLVTVEQTLILSVNTATALLARRLGPERLYHYARAFGFGCVTGIDLPGEVSGILRRPANWSGRSLETIAIGQEVGVTPLQLACAYAAIANGAVLVKPRIVREVRSAVGRTVKSEPTKVVRRVVSRETARVLTEILQEVVESGTGGAAQIPGISVAGKTGTAQRIDPETGHYDPRRHIASFAGFLPAENPQLVGVVVVDRPRGVGYGGQVAAPAFRRIMAGTLSAGRQPMGRDLVATVER